MLSGIYIQLKGTVDGEYADASKKVMPIYESSFVAQCIDKGHYLWAIDSFDNIDCELKLKVLCGLLKEGDFPLVIAQTRDGRAKGILKNQGFRTLEELIWNRTHDVNNQTSGP